MAVVPARVAVGIEVVFVEPALGVRVPQTAGRPGRRCTSSKRGQSTGNVPAQQAGSQSVWCHTVRQPAGKQPGGAAFRASSSSFQQQPLRPAISRQQMGSSSPVACVKANEKGDAVRRPRHSWDVFMCRHYR